MSRRGSVPSSEAEQPTASQPRRRVRGQVKSACLTCRSRKTKCDGSRPKCASCREDSKECIYVTREGEDQRAALNRNHAELQEERNQLHRLFRSIQTCPEDVSQEVFRCLRADQNDDIAALARNVEAVIERHAALRLPPLQSTVSGTQGQETDKAECNVTNQNG